MSMQAKGYRRRDLLERHLWRTGLSTDPAVAEQAALAACARSVDTADARDLLEVLGLIHPDGPRRVGININSPRPTGEPT